MTTSDIKRLGLILALQAEIEGMKACNMQREIEGSSIAYNEENFSYMAKQLREVAYKNDDRL